jgi:hypothetical protein
VLTVGAQIFLRSGANGSLRNRRRGDIAPNLYGLKLFVR